MKNKYLNINRIEFLVTNACTSKCRHCSVYDGEILKKERFRKEFAFDLICGISDMFDIQSIMTFGGEPLLFPEVTCAIHSAAKKAGIAKRQLITNGYFSNDEDKIKQVAKKIKQSGINSILLSADAFHDEFIPREKVLIFARELIGLGVENLKLHPAWVVDRENNNIYNLKTEECLIFFYGLSIPVSKGNNIFLSGRAKKYLSEYYEIEKVKTETKCGEAPYTSRPDNITSISVNPNGDIMVCAFAIGNIYKEKIGKILDRYNPYDHPLMKHITAGGITQLIEHAKEHNIHIDLSKFSHPCEVCRYLAKSL